LSARDGFTGGGEARQASSMVATLSGPSGLPRALDAGEDFAVPFGFVDPAAFVGVGGDGGGDAMGGEHGEGGRGHWPPARRALIAGASGQSSLLPHRWPSLSVVVTASGFACRVSARRRCSLGRRLWRARYLRGPNS
jgi:hypothetical protein